MSVMPSGLPYVVPPRAAERDLSRRLDALAELVKLATSRQGADGFSNALITDSEALLRRAGERLRLSASHIVVALAGGTGSGKSTLFNALSGATFSPPGVTRPTTRDVHACVWGMQGATPLLDWLGVESRHRYARASALDSGESALNGLVLLDLPDHDSVVSASLAAVDRLSKLADMLVFILDPQKYADDSVHRRYLIPLARHASVITVVLNQIDTLPPRQVEECAQDLRRLLDDEGLNDSNVLPLSARTGEGLDILRAVLAGAVADQQAASERISADIDSLLGGYRVHANGQVAPERALTPPAAQPSSAQAPDAEGAAGAEANGSAAPEQPEPARAPWESPEWVDGQPFAAPVKETRPPWEDAPADGVPPAGDAADPVAFVADEPVGVLVEALTRAAGITAVADTIATAREAQAGRFTGWPLARLARKHHDPLRELRAGAGTPGTTGPGTAQQSEVDNAITQFADAVGAQLPAPWSRSLRDAARSGAVQVPGTLAASVRAGIPAKPAVPAWWRLIALWQGLLVFLAVAGIAWSVVIAVGHQVKASLALLSDTSLIPWLLIMAAAVLLLGWLTASGCQNMALVAAEHERVRAEDDMRGRVSAVARDLVVFPAGHEISEYERFRMALTAAQAPATPIHP